MRRMDMLNIGLLAGSFAPFTLGHYDIAQRAAKQFATLYVAVAADTGDKRCIATLEERTELVRKSVANIPNVQVVTFEGFLTDYAREIGARTVVRGLRTFKDFEYEKSLSQVYKSQWAEIESVFLISSPEYSHISGTIVRDLALSGGYIGAYVCPQAVSSVEKIYGKR